jgi:hypothetical protein
MATLSAYPHIDIPNLDIWDFLFGREDKPYPDSKGEISSSLSTHINVDDH